MDACGKQAARSRAHPWTGEPEGMIQDQERQPGQGLPMRYLLVLWVLVLSTIAFLDRTNISIAGVQIGKEFKIDNSHLGWIFSAFLVGYASFQIPGGVLIRRFGPRRVLTFFVLFWGVFTVLTALVPPGMRGAIWVLVPGAGCTGSQQRGHVSLGKPVCGALVSHPRARQGQRHRLWRRRPGIGNCSAAAHVHHSALRLARCVLVLRARRLAGGRSLVFGGARYARTASLGEQRGTRNDRRRPRRCWPMRNAETRGLEKKRPPCPG